MYHCLALLAAVEREIAPLLVEVIQRLAHLLLLEAVKAQAVLNPPVELEEVEVTIPILVCTVVLGHFDEYLIYTIDWKVLVNSLLFFALHRCMGRVQ